MGLYKYHVDEVRLRALIVNDYQYANELQRLRAYADLLTQSDWGAIVEMAGMSSNVFPAGENAGAVLDAAARRLDPDNMVC